MMSRYIKYRKNTVYTPEIEQYIIDNFDKTPSKMQLLLKEKFGLELTRSAVMHKRQRLGYGGERETIHRHVYTPEEDEWLKTHSNGVHYKDITKRFNETFGLKVTNSSVEHRCQRLGFGNNIDCKIKKGQREIWNYKPVGTIVATKHNNNWGGYMQWIKVSDYIQQKNQPRRTNWIPLHQYVWEEANGKVPEGYMLTLKDRDYRNCSLENIMLVEKGEMVEIGRNKEWTNDADINVAQILVHRLNRYAKRRTKT